MQIMKILSKHYKRVKSSKIVIFPNETGFSSSNLRVMLAWWYTQWDKNPIPRRLEKQYVYTKVSWRGKKGRTVSNDLHEILPKILSPCLLCSKCPLQDTTVKTLFTQPQISPNFLTFTVPSPLSLLLSCFLDLLFSPKSRYKTKM